MTVTAAEQPTQVLAEYFSSLRLEMVPESVRDTAKRILLDSIACALAADRSEEVDLVANTALALGDGNGTTVIGAPERRSLGAGCLVNAFRVTAMTACDVYRPAHCHISPEVVPPALAVAEREGIDGAGLLTALIAGLETSVRVARGLVTDEFKKRRWHAPGIVGPFGGAAAVAHLLQLDATGTRDALAVAGSQASGTYASHGTPTVKFHQAHGALAGLFGALLASGGLKGGREILASPDGGMFQAFSGGGDASAVIDRLGDHWELDRISLRLWPGGTYIQPPLTTAYRIVSEYAPVWDAVDEVIVRVAPSVVASQSKYSRPQGTFECLASVEYTVTSMLRWHQVRLDHFSPEVYTSRSQQHAIEQVTMTADDDLSPLGCGIDVILKDGSRISAESETPKGHPDNPLTWSDLETKTLDFGGDRFDRNVLDELVTRVRDLEREESVVDLLSLTRP